MSDVYQQSHSVRWRWWYPPGAFRHADGGWDHHKMQDIGGYEADELAELIVQKHVEENGTDGANSFEIEIAEPDWAAGVYDVALEWEPTARAARRTSAAT